MTIRIVLIDDHPVVRAGLRALLDVEPDLRVVGEAKDGMSGIQITRELRPDIVLTDLLLPDVDGVVVTQTVCSEHEGIRVLILTGVNEDDEAVVRAVQAGAIGYLVKNTDTRALVEAIRSAASGQVHLSSRAAARLVREMNAPRNNDAGLTDRQRDVLRLIAAGRTNKEIAQCLQIALSTVKCHVRVILDKLDADSRTQAALQAVRCRMLPIDDLHAA
jgi:two-component system, NarL family, response regulator LiaR